MTFNKVHLRKIDSVGRIRIPEFIKSKFKIQKDSSIEYFIHEDLIIMKIYKPEIYLNRTDN